MTDIRTIPSSFGGGWAIPLTDAGRDALLAFFDEEPYPPPPLGGEEGYIVEPCEGADLAEYLNDLGVTFGT